MTLYPDNVTAASRVMLPTYPLFAAVACWASIRSLTTREAS